MKNLTEKQQTIIADITKEFIKINEEKKKRPKGSFFDIDGLLGQREADIEERFQIERNNKFYDEILKTKIQEDMDMLNIDLKELGLRAWRQSNWADWVRGYVIDTIDNFVRGFGGGHEIVVKYRLFTKTKCFKSEIERIEETLNKHNIESCSTFFNNLEEFTKDQNVIGNIKKLINRTNL
jgi:hypothetical protein